MKKENIPIIQTLMEKRARYMYHLECTNFNVFRFTFPNKYENMDEQEYNDIKRILSKYYKKKIKEIEEELEKL